MASPGDVAPSLSLCSPKVPPSKGVTQFTFCHAGVWQHAMEVWKGCENGRWEENYHLIHGLKAVKTSWVKNFCQTYFLMNTKRSQLSKHQALLLRNKSRGEGYKTWIYLPFEIFLHCTYVIQEETSCLPLSELYCPCTLYRKSGVSWINRVFKTS